MAERDSLIEQVIAHFMQVNQCTRAEYEEHSKEAWDTWKERSKVKEWTTEFGAYAHLVTPPARYYKDGLAYDR